MLADFIGYDGTDPVGVLDLSDLVVVGNQEGNVTRRQILFSLL